MANPTTNYGFVLPTSTDLVTDLPADFDVALQGVDTRLKALQPGTTLGDIAYSSATANTNTRLGIGTAGQVLTVASGVPSWATPAAAGGFTYADYTPTFTNFTLGNGTISKSRYAQSGKMVHFYGVVTLGSTSSVSGSIQFTLPVTAAASTLGFASGVGQMGDDGVGNYTAIAVRASTTLCTLISIKSDGTYALQASTSSTVPFTWTTNDDFRWSLIYEAA